MFQGFIRFPEFNEGSAPFRKNSNDKNTRKQRILLLIKLECSSVTCQLPTFRPVPHGDVQCEQVWKCLGGWGQLNGRRFPDEQVLIEPDSGHMRTPLENRQTWLIPLPFRIPLRAVKTPQCFTFLKLEFNWICTFHVRSLQHDAFVSYPYSTKINLHLTFE